MDQNTLTSLEGMRARSDALLAEMQKSLGKMYGVQTHEEPSPEGTDIINSKLDRIEMKLDRLLRSLGEQDES